jgi:hypothetical protein
MTRRVESRSRDFALYVGIGVMVVAGVWAFASHSARTGHSITDFDLNWLALAGTTAVALGETIRTSRRLWRKTRFWYVVAAAVILQLGLGRAVLWRAPRISTFVWGCIVFPATLAVLQAVIAHFTRDRWADGG